MAKKKKKNSKKIVKTVKKKRYKLKLKAFMIFILILVIIGFMGYKIVNTKLKNIYITGTNYITDNEIIELCDLKDYPIIWKIRSKKLEDKIKELDLVEDVNVSINYLGSIKIEITEADIMYLDNTTNKIVLSNNKEVDNNNYLGIPVLINNIPSDIKKDFIDSLKKVDKDILHMISEIEYNPSTSNGAVIDDKRFYLTMNDGNSVFINTVNIRKLNNYIEIYKAIADGQKGILYLDSYTSENYYFTPYGSIKSKEEVLENGDQEQD
ncbi:MAG: FtsQ-type POTRA domain-containing protein [Bacilli bacterium]|nr:FtsQ-type POTRA domain-containing protein [Bacilli bacterium]